MTTFTGTSGVDTLAGFGGNDEFYGLAGDDTLYGGGGNDTFFGGLGADEMYGGDGIDTASYAQATAGVSVDMGGTNTGGEANGDTFSSIENLIGSAYDDTLKGDSGDNVIDGGAGNDVIWGGPGADTLNGEAGDDNFVGGSGDDHIYGGTGNDTLDGQAGNDTLEGGTGDDIYFIDNTFDVITENAAEGNDTVEVGWEASTYTLGAELENLTFSNVSTFGSFTGNAGDNVITNEGTSAYIYGLAGDDTIYAGAGSSGGGNHVYGGDDNDTFYGSSNSDFMYGGAGDDIFIGSAADGFSFNDMNIGGTGTDTADFSNATVDLTVDLSISTAQNIGWGAKNHEFSSIENFTGGSGNDDVTGTSGANTLLGGTGNDTLEGGAGSDVLNGGAGTDTASYAGSSAGVTVEMGVTISGGDAAGDTLTSIENLIGSGHADTLKGNSDDNVIEGGDGNDVIWGGPGTDSLYGGAGDDNFAGGSGIDHINGGTGADTIDGNAGADTIDGGSGSDTVMFSDGSDADVINGFQAGAATDDVIDLSGITNTAMDSYAEVSAAATDDGTDTTIDFGSGDSIVLKNVVVADLHEDDFTFV